LKRDVARDVAGVDVGRDGQKTQHGIETVMAAQAALTDFESRRAENPARD